MPSAGRSTIKSPASKAPLIPRPRPLWPGLEKKPGFSRGKFRLLEAGTPRGPIPPGLRASKALCRGCRCEAKKPGARHARGHLPRQSCSIPIAGWTLACHSPRHNLRQATRAARSGRWRSLRFRHSRRYARKPEKTFPSGGEADGDLILEGHHGTSSKTAA